MGRKPRVERSSEEKWQIVQEGMKGGNVSETCRGHGITQTLYYRWKDEAEQGAKAALGGKSAAAAESEKDRRIRQLERTLGRKESRAAWSCQLSCHCCSIHGCLVVSSQAVVAKHRGPVSRS